MNDIRIAVGSLRFIYLKNCKS